MIFNKIILGKYYLSEDYNNFSKLKKRYLIDKSNRNIWPDIYLDAEHGFIFHYTQMSGHDGYNPNDNIETCSLRKVLVSGWASDSFRDFKILCDGSGMREEDAYIFGSGGLAHDIKGYNFRLFGEGLKRLRYTDADGINLYFVHHDYPYCEKKGC